jgi:hypothetical protein
MRNGVSVIAICLPKLWSKAKSNRTFCLTAASGALREYLRTCYFCRRYKFSIKTLLCNPQYFYIVYSDLLLSNTDNSLLLFRFNNGYAKPVTILRFTYVACLVLCYLVRTFNIIAQCGFISLYASTTLPLPKEPILKQSVKLGKVPNISQNLLHSIVRNLVTWQHLVTGSYNFVICRK